MKSLGRRSALHEELTRIRRLMPVASLIRMMMLGAGPQSAFSEPPGQWLLFCRIDQVSSCVMKIAFLSTGRQQTS